MSEFVHLHCHTEYSLLDGAIRLNDLCARAKDFGMPAAAITDHGNLYGAAYFYTTCKSYGIKPVIGCEVYVTKDHRDKDSEFSRVRHHLILLAKNNEGYHNLVRLVSKGFLDGFHYKPRVDKALLRQHSEGLIALSAPKRNALVHRAFQNFLMNTCIYTNIRLFYVLDRCLDPFSLFFADQKFDKL